MFEVLNPIVCDVALIRQGQSPPYSADVSDG